MGMLPKRLLYFMNGQKYNRLYILISFDDNTHNRTNVDRWGGMTNIFNILGFINYCFHKIGQGWGVQEQKGETGEHGSCKASASVFW